MASFVAFPNGNMNLTVSQAELDKIGRCDAKLFAKLLSNPTRVLGSLNPFRVWLEPTWVGGVKPSLDEVSDALVFAVNQQDVGAPTDPNTYLDDLDVRVESGKITVVELSDADRSWEEAAPNARKSYRQAIRDVLRVRPCDNRKLREALPDYTSAVIQATLTRMLKDDEITFRNGVYEIIGALGGAERATRIPGVGEVLSAFQSKGEDAVLSREGVMELTGRSAPEVDAILERLVSNGKLFQEGRGYSLATHDRRRKVNYRVCEVLIENKKPLTTAQINAALSQFHPVWITRSLDALKRYGRVTEKGGLLRFKAPEKAPLGQGINKVRAILRDAGEQGISAEEISQKIGGKMATWLIRNNLQTLVEKDKAEFDGRNFRLKIEAKPNKRRPSFRDEVREFLREAGSTGVSRDAVMRHFEEQSHRVIVALNELLGRREAILFDNLYYILETREIEHPEHEAVSM